MLCYDYLRPHRHLLGWRDSEGDESTGHASGRCIVELLDKQQADYSDDDVKHMREVASYVHRHLTQRPEGNVEDTVGATR